MLRTEAQFLSTALFDETPEMPVEHLRLSPAWLSRIQTVFRNAIALCKGAHLARLKALDEKVLDAATQSKALQMPRSAQSPRPSWSLQIGRSGMK